MLGRELFEGQRVRLAGLNADDAEAVAAWYGDGEFGRMFDADVAYPLGAAEIGKRIEGWATSDKDDMFTIRLKVNQTLVGIGGITSILWNCQTGWLNMALGPEHWSQRYGTEALALILRYGFYELNLHRIQLTVFEYNKRAVALYERAGFVREGAFREFVARDGRRYDMLLMGMLRKEWKTDSPQGGM